MKNEDIFLYLFALQESGRTNMFGAVPYMRREFPFLTADEAETILMEWMKRYSEIKKEMGL